MRIDLRRLAALAFVTVAFAFLGLALWRQREELLAFDWQIEPVRLALSLVALVATLLGGVAIWTRVLAHLGVRIGFRPLARVWFLSSLGRYIPGKIWQFVGVAELSRSAGISALVGITSLVVYMGFVALAAAAVGVLLFPLDAAGGLASMLLFARSLAPLALLAVHPRVIATMVRLAERLARRPFAPWLGSWRDGILLLAAAAVQWLGFGLAFHLLVSSLVDVGPAALPEITATYALAFLAGYLAFVAPAGLGAKDGAIAVLLSAALPVPLGVAAMLAVAARVWSIAGDVVPALFFLRGPGRSAHAPASTTPTTR